MSNGLPNEIKDVPAATVGDQVQQLVYSRGVTKIECEKQDDEAGWTIRSD